ncbi:nicotinamide riboside transporter PnuC, partial [Enterococcus faecium]
MNKNFLVNDFKGWETRSYLFLALMVGVQLIAFA